jgi:hypothetical protein
MTKFKLSLSGVNPKPDIDIYSIYPFTILQQSEKLLNPLVFTSK